MRTSLHRSLCALALFGLVACAGEERRPSVLLVSIDMLRADHVSAYGYERRTTPTLEALAADGVRFERHISSAPWTLPAHAALFTSLPDSVHGCVEGSGNALAPEVTTLAERFRDAGYRTAGFYAGPYLHEAFGLGQGFEEYAYCVPDAADLFTAEQVAAWAGDPAAHRRSHHGVTNPDVFKASSAWLEQHADEPFFLFVHLWDAHFDFVPPPSFAKRFADSAYDGWVDGREFFFDPRIRADMDPRDLNQLLALYDGEIMWCDAHVKLLLERLEALGVAEDTVVLVTSDHGTEFFDHGQKGHRRTLYDEALRVPLIVRAPGLLPAGQVVQGVTRTVDIGPTLLELCGLDRVAGLEGQSLVAAAQGQPARLRPALSELLADRSRLLSVTTDRGRIVWNRATDAVAWFDLQADPEERSPRTDLDEGLGAELAQALAQEVQRLREAAERHPIQAVAPELPPGLEQALHASGYGGGGG